MGGCMMMGWRMSKYLLRTEYKFTVVLVGIDAQTKFSGINMLRDR